MFPYGEKDTVSERLTLKGIRPQTSPPTPRANGPEHIDAGTVPKKYFNSINAIIGVLITSIINTLIDN